MYTLGIPKRQYRRATSVLGPEAADPIEYDSYKQDDGFWQFSFPEVDEYGFRDIVNLLKANGVTTIGADDQLTEKNIMKLSKLIKEQGSPDENEMIDILKRTLASWEQKSYRGGVEDCEKSDHYFEDIKDIIEDYEEEATMDKPSDLPAFGGLSEMYKSIKEGKQIGDNSYKTRADVLGEDKEIFIDNANSLDDVTIRWRGANHWGNKTFQHLEFEAGEVIDDHGNEGKDIEFIAKSEDEKWAFILDVSVGANYENSGNIEDWDWDTLIIDNHEDAELDIEDEKYDDRGRQIDMEEDVDEGTCGYGKNGKIGKKPARPDMLQEYETKLLKIRAGIIK